MVFKNSKLFGFYLFFSSGIIIAMQNVPGGPCSLYQYQDAFHAEIGYKYKRMSQIEKDMSLYYACQAGNNTEASNLIWYGAHVSAKNIVECNKTPLIAAARAGQHDTVKFLLSHDADPNIVDDFGSSALIYAVRGKNPAIVRTIIDGGSMINPRHTSAERSLIFQSADISFYTELTPLMDACALGHREIAEILLAHGAQPAYKDSRNWTALTYAVRAEKVEAIRLLTTHLRFNMAIRGTVRTSVLTTARNILEKMRNGTLTHAQVSQDDTLYQQIKALLE